MMDDRELLELAARAAGIEALWDETLSRLYIIDGEHVQGEFKPLTDDGDAFKLAVKLRMDVQNSIGDTCRAEVWDAVEGEYIPIEESHGDDPCAAMRRAITRAAAAIAQEMTDAQG